MSSSQIRPPTVSVTVPLPQSTKRFALSQHGGSAFVAPGSASTVRFPSIVAATACAVFVIWMGVLPGWFLDRLG